MQITIAVEEIKRVAKAFKFLKGNLLYERLAFIEYNNTYYFYGTDEVRTLFIPVTAKVTDYRLVGFPITLFNKVFGKAPVQISINDEIIVFKFGVTEVKAGAVEVIKLDYPESTTKIPVTDLNLNKLSVGKTAAFRFINVTPNWIYTALDGGISIERFKTPFPFEGHIAIPHPGLDFKIVAVSCNSAQFVLYGEDGLVMVLQQSGELLPPFDLDIAQIEIDRRAVNSNVAEFLRLARGATVIFTKDTLQANLDGTELKLEWAGPNVFGKFQVNPIPDTLVFGKQGSDYILILLFDDYEKIVSEVMR